MIRNEREYRITRSQAASFRKSVAAMRAEKASSPQESLAQTIQVDALESQLEELDEAIAEYEALVSGRSVSIEAGSIEELPAALIKARIASGLTQADLARQLSIPEQQIQRYEATEFSGASLKRIAEVASALKVKIQPYIFFSAEPKEDLGFYRRLGAVGLTRDFVERYLLSPANRAAAEEKGGGFGTSMAATRLARIFGWEEQELLKGAPLSMKAAAFEGVQYKKPKRINEVKAAAVTVYAHYLALLTLQCTSHLESHNLPRDPGGLRKAVEHSQGGFGFREVLQYVWDIGIPVLPLRIEGGLHGAMWRVDGRNVVVLKQSTLSAGRWLIDLLHEYCHAKEEPEKASKAVVELEDPLASKEASSEEESKATEFAVETALNARAEELFELCVKEADGKVEWLKRVVPMVAEREHVDLGILANALAHRLGEQGINWWGTAAKLQNETQNPWDIAKGIFLERVHLGGLNPIDRQILLQSLAEE